VEDVTIDQAPPFISRNFDLHIAHSPGGDQVMVCAEPACQLSPPLGEITVTAGAGVPFDIRKRRGLPLFRWGGCALKVVGRDQAVQTPYRQAGIDGRAAGFEMAVKRTEAVVHKERVFFDIMADKVSWSAILTL